jgi:hypothetical protein
LLAGIADEIDMLSNAAQVRAGKDGGKARESWTAMP